jgi:hypothetical protein
MIEESALLPPAKAPIFIFYKLYRAEFFIGFSPGPLIEFTAKKHKKLHRIFYFVGH